jgi:uncharacterized protein YsxB (DUF464 family)
LPGRSHNIIDAVIFLHNESPWAFKVSGHAGGGKKGYNIVCAAVSMLVRTTGRYLISMDLVEEETIDRDSVYIAVKKNDDGRAEAAWQFLLIGLNDLKQDYPDLITLKFERK